MEHSRRVIPINLRWTAVYTCTVILRNLLDSNLFLTCGKYLAGKLALRIFSLWPEIAEMVDVFVLVKIVVMGAVVSVLGMKMGYFRYCEN